MGNKQKLTIASIVIVVLAVIGVIGITVAHKDTTENLQSKEWTLTSQEESNTAKFEKDGTMILGKEPLTVNFDYSIEKKGDTEYLKLIHHEELGDNGKYLFKINKSDSGYSLKLVKGKTNQPAKNAMYGMTTKNNLVEQ